jgi:putative aldouronate transport system permease protein
MTTDVASGDVQAIGETIKYATIIVATVPILFVYPYLQRYFVKGVTIGAIKE